MIIGIFFGLALGGGIGIVLEAADTSVHEPRQLQAHFGLPVLAAIPQIWLESDRLKLRRSRIRTVLATSMLIAVGLAGGIANYIWVNGGTVVQEGAPPGATAGGP